MSFDGIPRPVQFNLQSDAMNPYRAANAAKTDRTGRPLVEGLQKEDKIKAIHKDEQQYHQPDDERERETLDEEEIEQILLFARMRGLMNFSLETGVRYEFSINPETGLVDLVVAETGKVVLTLTPEELMQLSEKIRRYAGMLTDCSG